VKKAFVCPECGCIDYGHGDERIVEIWKEVRAYSCDPETMLFERKDDSTSIEPVGLECLSCGWTGMIYPDYASSEAYPIQTLLVEIEEDGEVIKVAPIGSYWLRNPQKLADVLAESTGERVEVLSFSELG